VFLEESNGNLVLRIIKSGFKEILSRRIFLKFKEDKLMPGESDGFDRLGNKGKEMLSTWDADLALDPSP
jgi:hypothetical protein